MKFHAFERDKYTFTADLYTYVVTRDGEGGPIYTYGYARTITLGAVTDQYARLVIFIRNEDTDVIPLCHLDNLKDSSGQEIWANGIWLINDMTPELNLWGIREGFRGHASIEAEDG